MKPSSPISATASAGNRQSRSQSALLGASFSCAKLRAISRIMVWCSVSAIGASPGQRLAVVVEELAAVGRGQLGDDLAYRADAVWRFQRRTLAPHVRLHPSWMKQHDGDAVGS